MLGRECFASPSLALDAQLSGASPSLTAGADSYLAQFVKGAGGWQIERYVIAADGSLGSLGSVAVPVPSFPACDPTEPFFDGVSAGWGVLAAMAVAWGVKAMARGL